MRFVAAALLLAGTACGGALADLRQPALTAAPTATAAQVSAIALRADELRVAVAGARAQEAIAGTFGGPAAEELRRDALRHQQLHEHLETQVDARAIVHVSTAVAAPTAVVQTSGRQRLVAGATASGWDSYVDQWLYTLRWAGGWRVWEAVDLPPGEWWPA